jgi:hypothetical protein
MAKRASFKTILARQKKYVEIEVDQELRDTGQELKTADDKVVRDWRHKPTFRAEYNKSAAIRTVKIVPKGEHKNLWYYVDLGTKPHIIRAKNKPFLKFQTGYSARTAPVAKFNQGTGQKFGAWRQVKEVHHPGTKARKFSETFLKELSPAFPDRIQAAVKRGLNKANR